MNWTDFYADTLVYYTALARCPAWKAYAWHRVNEMAEQDANLWGMLPAQVLEGSK